MISKRLTSLFALSIFFIIAHMIEEWVFGFQDIFPFILTLGHYFVTPQRAVFGIFILMSWLLLLISFGFLAGGKWPLRIMSIFSIIYIFELHHPIRALLQRSYYPGAITGLMFPFLGLFYWTELLHNWRKK